MNVGSKWVVLFVLFAGLNTSNSLWAEGKRTYVDEISDVTVASGNEVDLDYEFSKNYPSYTVSPPFEPYIVIRRFAAGNPEVYRRYLTSGECTAGPHQIQDAWVGTDQGWFRVEFHIEPPGSTADAIMGREFYLDGSGGTSLDPMHYWLSSESYISQAPVDYLCAPLAPLLVGIKGGSRLNRGGDAVCSPEGGRTMATFPLSGDGESRQLERSCNSCDGGSGVESNSSMSPQPNAGDISFSLRPQNAAFEGGGFGPGFELDVFGSNGHAFMQNNEIPGFVLTVTDGSPTTYFGDTMGGDSHDGILYDEMRLYREARLLDGTDGTVDNLDDAVKIIVTYHTGDTLEFGLVNTPSGDPELEQHARLTELRDRNGHGYTIAYSAWNKISTITDDATRQSSFTYGSDQSGRLALSEITLPNTTDVTITFDGGQLEEVVGSDGWEMTCAISTNSIAQTNTLDITGPSGARKKIHVSQDYVEIDGDLINQPSNVFKMRQDGCGKNEVTVLHNPSDNTMMRLMYGAASLGTNQRILEVHQGNYRKWMKSYSFGWSHGYNRIETIDYETFYPEHNWELELPAELIDFAYEYGAVPEFTDEHGITYKQEFNSLGWRTKLINTNASNAFQHWTYNSDMLVTRFRDWEGNVTKFEYDSNGNLTKIIMGIKEISSSDVNQTSGVSASGYDEYADTEFVYYTSGEHEGRLKEVREQRHTSETDIYLTSYDYWDDSETAKPITGLLKTVTYSANVASGSRGVTSYDYDDYGYLSKITDPEGRETVYNRDGMARVVEVVHDGTSEVQILYGDGTTGPYGFKVKEKDRNDIVTYYEYDSCNEKLEKVTVGYETDDNILDMTAGTSLDRNQQQITEYVYLEGTDLVDYKRVDGKKTAYEYDYLGRTVSTTYYPNIGTSLTSTWAFYENNLLASVEDPYGRTTFYGYSNATLELLRQIVGMHDGVSFASNAAVLAGTRASATTPNPEAIYYDAYVNLNGQITSMIDPNGVETEYVTDSRGRVYRLTEAVGTGVEIKTEKDYDKAGNVVEVRYPRYFDSGDTNAYQKAFTTMEYTGRGLLKSRTEADGATEESTVLYEYFLDGRRSKMTDGRNNEWTTDYDNCCGRFLGSKDPAGHGRISNTDFRGNITHSVVVEDYASHTNVNNPVDGKTISEMTSRYNALGRLTASTTWLVAQGAVDPNNVDIAGIDSVSYTNGITSLTIYDVDLSDGVGLDHSSGINVLKLDGSGNYIVNLLDALDKLDDASSSGGGGLSFASRSAGSARILITPTEQISFEIWDGIGRTVMKGDIEPYFGSNPNDLVTWKCIQYDNTAQLGAFGSTNSNGYLLEIRSIDPLGNMVKDLRDGGGRTLRNVDESNNTTIYRHDANGNMLQIRDPNGVGTDYEYDELGRMTTMTDTYGDQIEFAYDQAGNNVTLTDAKDNSTSKVYDAKNRLTQITDRLNGVTSYTYDENDNQLTFTDPESKVTSYAYDSRNHQNEIEFADHSGGSSGSSTFGVISMTYDPGGRLALKTDQNGDTTTWVYDLAGRILEREYRLKVNSPSGSITDADSFTYNKSNQLLSAASGRYNNTVAYSYDDYGRAESEALSIGTKTYSSEYSYDILGRASGYTYPDGRVYVRSFTDTGKLYQTTYDSTLIETRSYDAGGRLIQAALNNGITTTISHRNSGGSKDNLLSEINIEKSGPITIDNLTYLYDSNKNKLSETRTGTMSAASWTTDDFGSSGFNDENQLEFWKRTSGAPYQRWDVSNVGNWDEFEDNGTTYTNSYSAAHELEQINDGSSSFNNVFDVRGNLTACNIKGHTYVWDFDNQLTEVSDGTTSWNLEYDALGRKVTLDDSTSKQVYVHIGSRIYAEYEYNASETSPNKNYVYGFYIDEPIVLDKCTGPNAGLKYYHRNSQFSIIALTDGSANVLERYSYFPHGKTTILESNGTTTRSSSIHGNQFCFTGREYLSEIQLYCFRNRFYDDKFGHFLSRDSFGYIDGYSPYLNYFSVNLFDPFGTCVLQQQEPHNHDPHFPPPADLKFKPPRVLPQDRDECESCEKFVKEEIFAKNKRWSKCWNAFEAEVERRRLGEEQEKICKTLYHRCETCGSSKLGASYSFGYHAITICADNSNFQEGFGYTPTGGARHLCHEYIHALQSRHCNQRPWPLQTCSDLLNIEMQAYYCNGYCRNGRGCLVFALGSLSSFPQCAQLGDSHLQYAASLLDRAIQGGYACPKDWPNE
jgi:RHS repeat-associated protein